MLKNEEKKYLQEILYYLQHHNKNLTKKQDFLISDLVTLLEKSDILNESEKENLTDMINCRISTPLLNYTGIVNKKVWIMADLKNEDLYDLFSDEIAEPEILDSMPMTTENLTKEEKTELELLKNTIRHELKTANVVQVIPRN